MKKSTILIAIIIVILIIAGGYYYWQKFLVKGPDDGDVITGDTAELAETADWQTYENEDMGIEVKIPKNWRQLDTNRGDYILFQIADEGHPTETEFAAGASFAVEREKEKNSSVYIQEIKDLFTIGELKALNLTLEDINFKEEPIIFLGNDAIKITDNYTAPWVSLEDSRRIEILMEKDNSLFILSAESMGPNYKIYLPIINQILSTFKFIER